MSNKFERLNHNEVISASMNGLNLPPTFKVSQLLEVIKKHFGGEAMLFENNGMELEVLRLDAKGWKKGKVRFSLEFYPNELDIEKTQTSNQQKISQPESSLDDIRRMIIEDN